MPKACPYYLMDYIHTYVEQMHRYFGVEPLKKFERCVKNQIFDTPFL